MTRSGELEPADVASTTLAGRVCQYFSAPRSALSATSLLSSTAWSVGIGAATTACAFVGSILIARGLGPSSMGDYSYWVWLVGTLLLLTDLGMSSAAMKFSAEFLARGEDARAANLVWYLVKLQGFVVAVLAAGVLLYGLLAAFPGGATLWAIVVALLLIAGPASVVDAAIKGAIDYRFAAHVAITSAGVQLALVAGILYTGGGVQALLVALFVTSAVALPVRLRRLRALYPRSPTLVTGPAHQATVFRYCRAKSGLSVLDAIVWARSEVFFLGLFSSTEQIAFYSLAYGIANQLIIGSTLLAHPLVPAFSTLWARNDVARLAQLYRAAVRYVALASFPLAVGGVAAATPLLSVLYTHEYTPAAPVLMIVGGSSLAVAVMFVCSSLLYGLGRPDYLVRINLVLALVNILASLLLIPRYGAVGAALANAVGPVLSVAAGARVLARAYGFTFPWQAVARVLLAACAAAFVATWLVRPDSLASLLLAAGVGAIAYVLAVAMLGVLESDDRAVLQTLAHQLPSGVRGLGLRLVDILIPLSPTRGVA